MKLLKGTFYLGFPLIAVRGKQRLVGKSPKCEKFHTVSFPTHSEITFEPDRLIRLV